jgi:hypothetical protein
VRGAAYALIDNTWDGRYALPFCQALASTIDQDYCFKESHQYMQGYFEKSSGDISQQCSRYAPESQRCAIPPSR